MKRKKGGSKGLYIVLGLGALVVGVFVFKDKICASANVPLLCSMGKIPAGGGIQMTKAGPRYLAGPNDLPSLV